MVWVGSLAAREAPGAFRPLYEDRYARIYAVEAGDDGALERLDPDCTHRPPDAIAACAGGNPACTRWFPLARAAMMDMGLPAPRP